MEQEVNYAQAEDCFEVSFHMSAYITVLLTIYNHFHALLTKLQSRVGDTVERMIICVEKTLQKRHQANYDFDEIDYVLWRINSPLC